MKIGMWITHLQRQAPVSVILAGKYLMDEIAYVKQNSFVVSLC